MQVDYHICGTHTYDLVGSSIQLINIATKATICASLKFEINEERLFRIWECGEYTVYWCAHMTFLYSMFAFTVATSQSVWIDCKQNYTNALASTPTLIIQLDAVLIVSTDVFFRPTCSTNIINTHWFDYGYGTYYIVYSAHTNDWTWENRLKIITIYIYASGVLFTDGWFDIEMGMIYFHAECLLCKCAHVWTVMIRKTFY